MLAIEMVPRSLRRSPDSRVGDMRGESTDPSDLGHCGLSAIDVLRGASADVNGDAPLTLFRFWGT